MSTWTDGALSEARHFEEWAKGRLEDWKTHEDDMTYVPWAMRLTALEQVLKEAQTRVRAMEGRHGA